MHTVIILSKHSSDLLREFRFLFQPFVDSNVISICDWNESGRSLETAVPDLYKQIHGRDPWRAIVLGTQPLYGQRNGFVPDAKNPFDFPDAIPKSRIPQESQVPLIRLSHMLCGYPTVEVEGFEAGYEYTDEKTGEICQVRASELSKEELYTLSQTYEDQLRSIYIKERPIPGVAEARRALDEKYAFSDVRPQEVYLISTRKHPEDESYIYESWKSPIEIESSDFGRRNHYPDICRFLCGSITNPENSRYERELMEFWLGVLTVAVNPIPASTLQAYRLFELQAVLSSEELEKLLNTHLNKLESALSFVQGRLRMKPENIFEDGARIVQKQHIQVVLSEVSGRELQINTRQIGLSRDCPQNELGFWNENVREKTELAERYMKLPCRAVDRASAQVKARAEDFFHEDYELDRFQVEELKEEMAELEEELLSSDTRTVIDRQHFREEIKQLDGQVKKDISMRMRRATVVSSGIIILLCYLLGYVPYIFSSMQIGGKQAVAAFGVSMAATLVAAIGGIVALILLRKRIVESMERFNTLMKSLLLRVNSSGRKFEQYFTTLCTYMKAQSIYKGVTRQRDAVSERIRKLRTHRQALRTAIQRDEGFVAAFGVKRTADIEKNVTRFFNEDRAPRKNSLYYYEVDTERTEIPLNTAGDMIRAPYRFVAGLKIERVDLYEERKGVEL